MHHPVKRRALKCSSGYSVIHILADDFYIAMPVRIFLCKPPLIFERVTSGIITVNRQPQIISSFKDYYFRRMAIFSSKYRFAVLANTTYLLQSILPAGCLQFLRVLYSSSYMKISSNLESSCMIIFSIKETTMFLSSFLIFLFSVKYFIHSFLSRPFEKTFSSSLRSEMIA